MISVIIPIYNVENYLHVCVNCILKQSYEDFEIICIDDASTDSSQSILEYFAKKDSRIKIYKNDDKKGFKYCQNKALKIANGSQVLFLNADEWLSFDTLEKLSHQTDYVLKTNAVNKISDFRIENHKKTSKSDVKDCKNIIQELQNDNVTLQKKLGSYTKPEIINKINNKEYSNLTIAIKSPHPEGTKYWGDLFFALAIKKSFQILI